MGVGLRLRSRSQFVGSSPASGSVLTAQSLELLQVLCPPLSLPLPCSCSVSLPLSKINIKQKKSLCLNCRAVYGLLLGRFPAGSSFFFRTRPPGNLGAGSLTAVLEIPGVRPRSRGLWSRKVCGIAVTRPLAPHEPRLRPKCHAKSVTAWSWKSPCSARARMPGGEGGECPGP